MDGLGTSESPQTFDNGGLEVGVTFNVGLHGLINKGPTLLPVGHHYQSNGFLIFDGNVLVHLQEASKARVHVANGHDEVDDGGGVGRLIAGDVAGRKGPHQAHPEVDRSSTHAAPVQEHGVHDVLHAHQGAVPRVATYDLPEPQGLTVAPAGFLGRLSVEGLHLVLPGLHHPEGVRGVDAAVVVPRSLVEEVPRHHVLYGVRGVGRWGGEVTRSGRGEIPPQGAGGCGGCAVLDHQTGAEGVYLVHHSLHAFPQVVMLLPLVVPVEEVHVLWLCDVTHGEGIAVCRV